VYATAIYHYIIRYIVYRTFEMTAAGLDMTALFAKALGIGLLLAVPLGPIGLLCLRRSLTSGMAAGLAVGLGAATADGIYAAVAAFALGLAAPFIAEAGWLGFIGGVALIAIGLKDILHRDGSPPPPSLRGHIGVYAGVVLLTLTNPATVLTFGAIILGLGLVPDMASPTDGMIFVAGVFLGSTAWWVVLSALGGLVGDRLPPASIRWTRRAAGAVFVAFGVYALMP
jgi:threonine/homoserine/homoserine lactone efflux protein